MAYIRVNRKNVYLGLFPSIEEAAKARKAGEITYWGNNPQQEELCIP
jgi:hypothetical protein